MKLLIAGLLLLPPLSPAAVENVAVATDGIVQLTPKPQALEITINGKPFTTYNYGKELPKPYFWPVRDAAGDVMTRPLVKPTDKPQPDHKHHRGLWFSVDEINDIKFWAERGTIQNVSVRPIVSKGKQASFHVTNNWLGKDSKPVLVESTRVTIFADRTIAYDALLIAGKQPVTFGDTKEGMFGFRMVESMHEPMRDRKTKKMVGEGKVENAEGLKGTKECWGKTSKWIDYYGPVNGKTVGVAIFDNPHNFRPSRYHVRDYGLFSISPFGEKSYTNGKKPAGIVKLQPGHTLRLQYALYVHDGDTKAGDVAGAYRKYLMATGTYLAKTAK